MPEARYRATLSMGGRVRWSSSSVPFRADERSKPTGGSAAPQHPDKRTPRGRVDQARIPHPRQVVDAAMREQARANCARIIAAFTTISCRHRATAAANDIIPLRAREAMPASLLGTTGAGGRQLGARYRNRPQG